MAGEVVDYDRAKEFLKQGSIVVAVTEFSTRGLVKKLYSSRVGRDKGPDVRFVSMLEGEVEVAKVREFHAFDTIAAALAFLREAVIPAPPPGPRITRFNYSPA